MQTENPLSKTVFCNTGGVMATPSGVHLLIMPNDTTPPPAVPGQVRRSLAGSAASIMVSLTRVTPKGARELPPIPADYRYVELPVKVAPLMAQFTKGCHLRIYHGMHANVKALRIGHYGGLPSKEWTILPPSMCRCVARRRLKCAGVVSVCRCRVVVFARVRG